MCGLRALATANNSSDIEVFGIGIGLTFSVAIICALGVDWEAFSQWRWCNHPCHGCFSGGIWSVAVQLLPNYPSLYNPTVFFVSLLLIAGTRAVVAPLLIPWSGMKCARFTGAALEILQVRSSQQLTYPPLCALRRSLFPCRNIPDFYHFVPFVHVFKQLFSSYWQERNVEAHFF